MTENQKIFADEYLKDRNATRAYKAAYPKVTKDTTAATNGGRLLRNAEILKYIESENERAQDDRIMTVRERKAVLSDIARSAPKNSDKAKAIDILNKMDGEYVTKIEGNISADVSDPFKGLTTEELRKLAED